MPVPRMHVSITGGGPATAADVAASESAVQHAAEQGYAAGLAADRTPAKVVIITPPTMPAHLIEPLKTAAAQAWQQGFDAGAADREAGTE